MHPVVCRLPAELPQIEEMQRCISATHLSDICGSSMMSGGGLFMPSPCRSTALRLGVRLRAPVQVQLFIKDAQVKFGRHGEHLAASVVMM